MPVNYDSIHFTVRKVVREEYIIRQEGNCCHCGASLKEEPARKIQNMKISKKLFPDSFFKWPVHLHHNRKTGMTIGAVHNKCNAVLWQYYGE